MTLAPLNLSQCVCTLQRVCEPALAAEGCHLASIFQPQAAPPNRLASFLCSQMIQPATHIHTRDNVHKNVVISHSIPSLDTVENTFSHQHLQFSDAEYLSNVKTIPMHTNTHTLLGYCSHRGEEAKL